MPKHLMPMEEFIEDVVCVMVDEVHMAKADVLKQLLTSVFSTCTNTLGINRNYT